MRRLGTMGMIALLAGAPGCGKEEKGSGEKQGKGGDEGSGAAAGKAGDGDESAAKRAHDEIEKTVGTPGADREFEVESAKLVFELDGVEKGTQTAWIGGHGSTVVVKREITRPMEQTTILLWKDGKQASWTLDAEGKNRTVMITRLRAKATELGTAVNDEQLEMGGYENKGTETIAGVEADVWERKGMTLWRWKGMDVKTVVTLGKTTSTEAATSIEEGVEPPADVMAFPDGYEIKDMTN